jgi:putative FmdB family regulatory protein
MPTYEYACRSCGSHLEVVQSFTDDPLTECPSCAGPLRKVFGNIGITFKGSGFYKTDSRGAPSKAATGDGGTGGDGGTETKKEPDKKEKTPEKPAAKGDGGGSAKKDGGTGGTAAAKGSGPASGAAKSA